MAFRPMISSQEIRRFELSAIDGVWGEDRQFWLVVD
jgi:hypothetical protein